MAYTLQDFRDLVRAHLDLDETDLTDDLTDEFVRDAAQRLQYSRQTWPFYRTSWTFDTVAAQADYTFVEVQNTSDDVVAEIALIRGVGRELRKQARTDAHIMNPQGSESTGEPKFWSEWASSIRLDPIPTAVETLTVEGWKAPSDWVSDGVAAVSDAPEPFDRVILNWAVGRAYAFQDEPDSALHFYDLGDERLRFLTKTLDDISPAVEVIMGGGSGRDGYTDLTLPWE